MKPDTRILLADDHALVRAGIRMLIEGIPGFRVVAETGDGQDAVKQARQIMPDIVLMDLAMPGLNGLDAIARIVKECPTIRVVALSMHTAENYVLEALRLGAAGYVVKDAAVEELEQALNAVSAGESFLSPAVSRHVLQGYLRLAKGETAPEPRASIEQLTPRQREILQLIAEGRSTRDIAEQLSISIKTVETHRSQIMQRLDIHDVAGLTRYAIRAGLIEAEN